MLMLIEPPDLLPAAIAICQGCRVTVPTKGPRLPRGWKRAGDQVLCATCLHARYVHRSVTVPIAGPIDATWAELGAALRETWAQTTACANWIVTALYTRDIRRQPGDAKMPAMRPVYLYPEARAAFPLISPINLTSLLQQVERTYRAQRYELLWTGTRSLAVHRYPVPAPLHATAWRLHAPDPGNGSMCVDVRLGDRWWTLRLRAGREFAIQARQLRALHDGSALAGAGAVYSVDAHVGDHRHAETRRRVLVKLVGWFPVARSTATGTLTVTTAASDLWLVRTNARLVATIHADDLRRVIRAYTVRRKRARDDGAPRLAVQPGKQERRLKTLCQQYAARIATIAAAQGCGCVEYEDDERGFCDPFPWTRLRGWLQSAVEGRGLIWEYASGATGTSSASPLAARTSQEESA